MLTCKWIPSLFRNWMLKLFWGLEAASLPNCEVSIFRFHPTELFSGEDPTEEKTWNVKNYPVTNSPDSVDDTALHSPCVTSETVAASNVHVREVFAATRRGPDDDTLEGMVTGGKAAESVLSPQEMSRGVTLGWLRHLEKWFWGHLIILVKNTKTQESFKKIWNKIEETRRD